MGRYRKRPIEIEAFQWSSELGQGRGVEFDYADGVYCVHTLEGRMIVSEGDWIITGVAGEIYPCKPEIFNQTYEAV